MQGGVEFLKHMRVLWFEMASCMPETRRIFDFLDRDFVLFDFVPVGQPSGGGVKKKGYKNRHNFSVNESIIEYGNMKS